MTKQKVIEGLKCHAGEGSCDECPYNGTFTIDSITCSQTLTFDAFNLLNKQENGVEPKVSKEEDGYTWYYCGKCGYEIDPSYENYCPTCGTKIKLKEEENA